MTKIETKYRVDEITVKVNNRELWYDFLLDRAIYTYKGINKREFNLNNISNKKYKLAKKYGIRIVTKNVKLVY